MVTVQGLLHSPKIETHFWLSFLLNDGGGRIRVCASSEIGAINLQNPLS